MLQRFPRALEKDSLLRVEHLCFAWGITKKACVKQICAFQDSSGSDVIRLVENARVDAGGSAGRTELENASEPVTRRPQGDPTHNGGAL